MADAKLPGPASHSANGDEDQRREVVGGVTLPRHALGHQHQGDLQRVLQEADDPGGAADGLLDGG
eukprot:3722890-Alexandrium_andersonii.AAC.1